MDYFWIYEKDVDAATDGYLKKIEKRGLDIGDGIWTPELEDDAMDFFENLKDGKNEKWHSGVPEMGFVMCGDDDDGVCVTAFYQIVETFY
ncbi:hypothetical protein EBT25_19145 [bacterium]|nr:hypothetical protein [bacterium]